MFNIRIDKEFITKLKPESRRWLARAVVNMINIDNRMDPKELCYMHDAVELIDEKERDELISYAKERKQMELSNLQTDREFAPDFLYYFATLIAADNKINQSEVDFFLIICAKLGYPDFAAKDVLKWTQDLVKLNKDKIELQRNLQNIKPIFRSVERKRTAF